MSSSRGFTLIELMVVLIILGIASSMIFMSVGKGMLGARGRGLLKAFSKKLTEARAMSIGQGRPVYFLIYGDERAFGIEGKGREEIPEDVEVRGEGVKDYDDGVYAICFFPDGSTSGGAIILSMPDGKEYRFEIDRFFGAIKLIGGEG